MHSFGVNRLIPDCEIWPQETRDIALECIVQNIIDILSRLGVTHEYDGQTDRLTDILLANAAISCTAKKMNVWRLKSVIHLSFTRILCMHFICL